VRSFVPARARERILADLAAIDMIEPSRTDCIEAAELANERRRGGVQLGSVDALLAQLAIANDLVLLTTGGDFVNAARRDSASGLRPR
jgi:predicted nucleic acid-binding protein